MKSMNDIYEALNSLIQKQKWEQVETFLTGCMEQAQEEEQHGIYIAVGNELLTFFRESGQYAKAFSLAENILLLMEEFQLEDTEHFALVMMNTAASYGDAGRLNEALSYYARAVRILEKKPDSTDLLAEAQTKQAMLLSSLQETAEAQKLFRSAITLYEQSRNGEADSAVQKRNDIFYLTALTGLGEAAYRDGQFAEALRCFEKAGSESAKRNGQSEGTKILWNNCALLCRESGDEEKEAYYKNLAEKG